jgi:hypothetical protein
MARVIRRGLDTPSIMMAIFFESVSLFFTSLSAVILFIPILNAKKIDIPNLANYSKADEAMIKGDFGLPISNEVLITLADFNEKLWKDSLRQKKYAWFALISLVIGVVFGLIGLF